MGGERQINGAMRSSLKCLEQLFSDSRRIGEHEMN